ncbi:GntR family transcriptional regulator [Bacillus swezeyi]|uniref:GntR family transcriptional regulator n=2 Tax=Bacillus swezeyi TaxID=1925020 RepID=A0A1R1QWX3_9BACI|nr:GntR family transcriptional regulator [Bacillus swezeyi]MEC1259121.1 GntR family transcriptional regulator [Bacillus swezeyi]MED1740447.1 GntR family transcriptional regulator [Bacillus swezeyi]MED2927918.1 GntR family transcriptional regulator [Bacillus swezeyi]MED2942178.1 GntR family transcriptional regulator [Bacillus swezeyi]MED2965170.1 GntR family transcriptional regulator [Bacillus swezeyi]
MHSSNPVKRQSASDYAYNELRSKIIELEYPPSEQLAEDSLAKDLEISRTPLRQALYRLELEGLVNKQPNGRLRVCPISPDEAKEVFKVREALEGLLTAEAAQLMTTERLHQLEDRIELMKMAAAKDRKADTVKYGSEFHSILHAISTNATAKRFLEQLESRIERYRRISGYKNPHYKPSVSLHEHLDIFDAVKERNSSLAEAAMRSHIRRSLRSIEETLERLY